MTKDTETYFAEGCGRCKLGGTPACKVHTWAKELQLLRAILLDCGLVEESKWGMPCYTHGGSNVLMLAAFKDFCSVSFFKGALLQDEAGILGKAGENTQAARLVRFTNVQDVAARAEILRNYIFEAIEIEKAGLKVEFKQPEEFDIPEEFLNRMEQMPALKEAFYALTPGRRRGYLIHFSGARQTKTRAARIEKCIPAILSGKGMND
jgi:uncharacterized protein YdeI (YjbR/CyaY-like superfamily)